MNKLLSKI